MALKSILLRKKISDKQAEEKALRDKAAAFEQRESEIAKAIEEAKTEEEKAAVERAVADFETEKADSDKELRGIADDIKQLEDELRETEAAQAEAENGPEETPEERDDSGRLRSDRRRKDEHMNTMELREAQKFQETGKHAYTDVRSLLRTAVTSANTANPVGVGGINDAVGGPSALIDMITLTDCTGMGNYKVAVMTGDASAAETSEGTAPTESEPTFSTVTLTPANYATVGYISKEIRKLTPLNYEEKVRMSARRALRAKLNNVAMTKALASSLNTTLELVTTGSSTAGGTLFTADLLSKIILEYGGDEGVEGAGVLFLSKADLKAFAAVRGANSDQPIYAITPDTNRPSTGIIKDNFGLSCRYCLTKDLTALSTKTLTTTASKHMVYGNPKCLEMGLFGSFEVEVNDGYKFAEGLLTVRGDVSADADVTVKNGFVVITAKKGA